MVAVCALFGSELVGMSMGPEIRVARTDRLCPGCNAASRGGARRRAPLPDFPSWYDSPLGWHLAARLFEGVDCSAASMDPDGTGRSSLSARKRLGRSDPGARLNGAARGA